MSVQSKAKKSAAEHSKRRTEQMVFEAENQRKKSLAARKSRASNKERVSTIEEDMKELSEEIVKDEKLDEEIQEAAEKVKKKKSSVKHNLPVGEDEFDDSLVPQSLVDEVYAELMAFWLEGAEEEEVAKEAEEAALAVGAGVAAEAESIDEKKRRYSKKEKQHSKDSILDETGLDDRKASITGTPGMTKPDLFKMSNLGLEKLTEIYKKELAWMKTENYILDGRLAELEKEERLIDSLHPPFVYKIPKQEGKPDLQADQFIHKICSSSSSSSEDETLQNDLHGDFTEENDPASVVQPNLPKDPPKNFDVIKKNYGIILQGLKSSPVAGTQDIVSPDKEETKQDVNQDNRNVNLELNLKSKIPKSDPDFPGFEPSTAKRLPFVDKVRYSLEQKETEERNNFEFETRQLRRESRLDVMIFAYNDMIKICVDLRKEFCNIMDSVYIKRQNYYPAERVLRGQALMRNKILGEENKCLLAIKQSLIDKNKIDMQIQCNKDLSKSTNRIDFDHLVCQNSDYWEEIESLGSEISQMKMLHTGQREILSNLSMELSDVKNLQKLLERRVEVQKRRLESFAKHGRNLEAETKQMNALTFQLNTKLLKSQIPTPQAYIQIKEGVQDAQTELKIFQRKIEVARNMMNQSKLKYFSLTKKKPDMKTTIAENEQWMEKVKTVMSPEKISETQDNVIPGKKVRIGIKKYKMKDTPVLLAASRKEAEKKQTTPKKTIFEHVYDHDEIMSKHGFEDPLSSLKKST